jgi:hypothetical protein
MSLRRKKKIRTLSKELISILFVPITLKSFDANAQKLNVSASTALKYIILDAFDIIHESRNGMMERFKKLKLSLCFLALNNRIGFCLVRLINSSTLSSSFSIV